MNNTDTKKLFNLKKARCYIKETYHRDVSAPTLRNWITHGLLSHSGRRYVLRACKRAIISRGWFTCEKFIDEYMVEIGS